MRVLYVDDDRINTLVFTETCRLVSGVEVACAANGADAEEQCRQFGPGLLVVDLHLPDTDGLALLPRLRALCAPALPPAYLCTAEEPALVADDARRAGYDGCWTKPVTVDELARQLRALELRLGAAGPAAPDEGGTAR